MATPRWVKGALIPDSFQAISLANSTALGLNTTAIQADVLHISVETQDVRYRADGTDPTINTGVLLQADGDYWMEGFTGSSDFMFQRSTGTCLLNIAGYKHKGTE